jgi:hypothetical protein
VNVAAKLDQIVVMRMPTALVSKLRAAAREDDRPLASFVRTQLARIVGRRPKPEQADAPR